MIFFDSDSISYLIKNDSAVLAKVKELESNGEEIAITSINVYEIKRGFRASPHPGLEKRFDNFLNGKTIFHFDNEAVLIAADVYAALKRNGTPVGEIDILIAAIVIRNNGTLFTNNVRHFEVVPHLNLL